MNSSVCRRVLFLEPIGGIAGDMFLAAAVDLGVPVAEIAKALSDLDLGGSWSFSTKREERHGIVGTHLDVVVDPSASKQQHRSLSEIQSLIRAARSMPDRAKERALAAFRLLGEAEARVHNVPVEQIHFHEVGAIDSIVDICGAAAALELLGDPEIFASPPPLGSGTISAAHGNLPIPAPATLEILRGVPVRFEGVGELTTPTGATLLKTFAQIRPPAEMIVESVGYGLGTRDSLDRANVLRASIGRATEQSTERLVVVEANLDDCNPQIIGTLIEVLLEKGAVDSYVLPALMKKGRPGHLLVAVVPEANKQAVVQAMFTESTSLGVRSHAVERSVLSRTFEEVDTPYGRVRIKLGIQGGEVRNASPEFEDCRALAKGANVPVKHVLAVALAAYYKRRSSNER